MKIIYFNRDTHFKWRDHHPMNSESIIIYGGEDLHGNENYIIKPRKGKKVIHRILKSMIYDVLEENDIDLR